MDVGNSGWTAEHRHALVTTDDFRAAVRSAGGVDAENLLSEWIDHVELPGLG